MKALLRFTSIVLVLVLLMPAYLSSSAESNTAVEFFPTTKEMRGWHKQIFDTQGWVWAPMSNNKYMSMISHNVDSRGALTLTNFTADAPSIEYTYVGKELVVDLKKTPYLFFDFTAYRYVWSIALKFGEAGSYKSDFSIAVNQEICKLKSQYLVNSSQFGLPGDYQGYIDLNKLLGDSGFKRSDGSSFKDAKIRIVGLYIALSNFRGTDAGGYTSFAQFRNISIGSGTRTFASPPKPEDVELPQPSFKASSILSSEKKYYEGTAIRVPVDKTDGWKTNISRTELGELSDKSAFLKVKATNSGMTITPTGQSIKQKAYINGLAVGWPKLSYTYETPVGVNPAGTYIFYDFTMNTNWDIYLKFADAATGYISLADVLNGLDTKGAINNISTAEGARGFGIPGTYKGAVNLEEIMLYYMTISGNFRASTFSLLGVDIVYENAEDKSLNRSNVIRELVIGNPVFNPFDIKNIKDTVVTVNKPGGGNQTDKPETTQTTESTSTTTKSKDTSNEGNKLPMYPFIIIGVAVILGAALVLTVVLAKKNKSKNEDKDKGAN